MDTTRGLAILAVISFHTVSEIKGRGILVPVESVYLNAAAAPIRMPLLIFLSGLLLPKAIAKGEHRYFSGKVRTILYPYLIWAALNTVIAAQLQGQSDIPGRVERAITASPGYAWFLALLLTFYIVAWPLQKIPRVAVISVAAVLLLCIPAGSPGLTNPAAFLVGFFFLGWWCGENGEAFKRFLSSQTATWIGMAGVAAMLVHALKLQMTFNYEATMLPWVAAASFGCTGHCHVRGSGAAQTSRADSLCRPELAPLLRPTFPDHDRRDLDVRGGACDDTGDAPNLAGRFNHPCRGHRYKPSHRPGASLGMDVHLEGIHTNLA
ncbi:MULTISPECIES: acyltransferase family protein [Rhodococcus]|nr:MULTISPECIES: acyltransferase [Rhodococcus]QQZ12580.1 acyltransferase [Rhodococcus sp. 21391]